MTFPRAAGVLLHPTSLPGVGIGDFGPDAYRFVDWLASAGQRIYERTRPLLLQVRTLLKTQDSQSSVGSAFLVTADGHMITNYHVVSSYALAPERHRLVYATVDGQQGALQLSGESCAGVPVNDRAHTVGEYRHPFVSHGAALQRVRQEARNGEKRLNRSH